MKSSEKVALNKHHAIVDAFFKDLLASSPEAGSLYNKPYLAFPYPIFGIDTKPGYIFDDVFWDVFHAYPLHVCHVTRLTDGPQFDEERVFEIRFKVDRERLDTLEASETTDLERLVEWLEEKAGGIYDDDEPIDRGRAAGWGETIGYIADTFGVRGKE